MNCIRVFLVNDRPLIRDGVRRTLQNSADIEIVGEADSIRGALALIVGAEPDIILAAVNQRKGSSLDDMREIVASCQTSRILVITSIEDAGFAKDAIMSGAHGVILETLSVETLLTAIRKVHDGEAWLDRKLTSQVLSEINRRHHGKRDGMGRIEGLTPRECEIVKLICAGCTNKEIAERLFISEKTVRNQLTIIYSKLNLATRLELAIYASSIAPR